MYLRTTILSKTARDPIANAQPLTTKRNFAITDVNNGFFVQQTLARRIEWPSLVRPGAYAFTITTVVRERRRWRMVVVIAYGGSVCDGIRCIRCPT